MNLSYYIRKAVLNNDPVVEGFLMDLKAQGHSVTPLDWKNPDLTGMDLLLSLGGDGTFLCASGVAAAFGVPVAGVNFGRMGFLSENSVDDILDALPEKDFRVEERSLLSVVTSGGESFMALNEVCVNRTGSAMLGVDVVIDNEKLPTYWADGLLVATSSGSTAYNLSVGGPICTPDAGVFVVAPISPHNLNLRPLVIPDSATVSISFQSRQSVAMLSADNVHKSISSDQSITIFKSPVCLKMARFGKTNFIEALRTRLFWGEDVRNK